jgi:hypothetical protein
VAAHGNSVSVGLCQGYSAVLLPQLQQNGSQLMVTDVEASWIGKALRTLVARRGPPLYKHVI